PRCWPRRRRLRVSIGDRASKAMEHSMKRIAVFCDGTWNRAVQASNGAPCPTNAVKLAERVERRDGPFPQVSSYCQGVGTGGSLDLLTSRAFVCRLDVKLSS